MGDLPYQTLQVELTDEELFGPLVTSDLPEGDCTGPASASKLNGS